MTTLVLDKSALRAAPTQFLFKLREQYDFLLAETLLYELGTENISERVTITGQQEEALNKRLEAQFAKAVKVFGNKWIGTDDALKWEITEGSSARFAPRMPLQGPLGLHELLDGKTVQDCLAFDSAKASFASFAAPVRSESDKKVLADHRKIREEDFFCRLAHGLGPAKSPAEIRKTVVGLAQEGEKRHGWKKSPYFFPRKDWFIYGIALAHMVYLPWKLWKYGNDAPSKAANAAYDLYYIGFMAIADGLLSSDKNMLKLAWAMWPDKRQHICEYKDEKVGAFVPIWSSTSGAVSPEEPLPFL